MNRNTDSQELEILKNEKRKIILSVGRITKQKGHRYLVEAARFLKQKGINDHLFMILGKHEDEFDSVLEQIHSYGLEECFLLPGAFENVHGFFCKATIFVMPSLWEGMPNALMEAMSCGLPAIATDIEANRELVRHGDNGFLVPPKDPEALANAISKLLNCPETAKKAGSNARIFIQNYFSTQVMAEKYEGIYEKCII